MTDQTSLSVTAPPSLDPALAAALAALPTPVIGDCLERLSGPVGLRRYSSAAKLVGIARTVKTRPGDNLALYRMIVRLRPGDVLVVDGGGDVTNALMGELMTLEAKRRGCAGLLIDGAIRDVGEIADIDLPTYARGHSLRGPYKSHPGFLDVTVAIGGQVITAGDVVVGDADGVVTFPAARAAEIVALAGEKFEREEGIRRSILSGEDTGWVEAMLADLGQAE
ncbi:RraA family protein [Pseudoxanthobacter sp. M-2]|uniref:RraA family protein n=1 Tax=Pseudoxanthobacter sp. M-2 TaxID=3078754 RepID=UPI0038FCB5B1